MSKLAHSNQETMDAIERNYRAEEESRVPNLCELCGEPMPAGEQMFKFHGYSGNCPKPPLPRPKVKSTEELQREVSELNEKLNRAHAAVRYANNFCDAYKNGRQWHDQAVKEAEANPFGVAAESGGK